MTTRIGINGFGRIGRNVLREILLQKKPVGVVAINDLTDARTLAHLLKYDSIHRTLPFEIEATDNAIKVDGKEIKITAERDPQKLPWKEVGVDIVLECTGIFTQREKAALHLSGGAKKVVISAPSPDPDVTIAYGINHSVYDTQKHTVLSCASCTTNALAPVAKVIMENFSIVRGTMTTIHSYTDDQVILDFPHKDLRRARAAAVSQIPSTTGAAKAIGLVLPELAGKLDGFAIRVPTVDVSVVDLVVEVEREVSADDVNRALRNASEKTLKGVLGYSEEPLVSSDYIGNRNSSIVDSLLTMVVGKKLVKVITWYDNEIGFSNRMIDVVQMVSKGL